MIKYWLFINNVISFLILWTILFFVIKAINKLKKADQKKEEAKHVKTDEVMLLEDIRDLLKKSHK
jgi:large conductance mechanosensitive channel